jgi:hypothetical protein
VVEPKIKDVMREEHMTKRNDPPPCGGITRIRFKGSAPKFFEALSAMGLPRFLEATLERKT